MKKMREKVDWEAIKRQLGTDRQSLERNFAPSAEACRQILQARAVQLAREARKENERDQEIEILEFLIAGERYAFEVVWVREATVLKDLTPLPGTPPFVLGIANVRGHILSVIDLRRFFDLPAKGLTQLNKVVILRNESMEFGVLTDEIVGVAKLAASALQDSLPTLTGVRAEYLRGVTADRLVLLDAQKLLNDENIIVNEEISA